LQTLETIDEGWENVGIGSTGMRCSHPASMQVVAAARTLKRGRALAAPHKGPWKKSHLCAGAQVNSPISVWPCCSVSRISRSMHTTQQKHPTSLRPSCWAMRGSCTAESFCSDAGGEHCWLTAVRF